MLTTHESHPAPPPALGIKEPAFYGPVIAVVILVLLFLAALLSYHAFTAAAVSPDSGYYVSLGRRMAEGWVPFRDIISEYPPVGMYLYALPAYVTQDVGYSAFYLVNYLALVGSAVVVGAIAFSLTRAKRISLLSAALSLTLCLYFQGYYTLLEPFTAFFYLLAIFFLVRGMQQGNWVYFFLSGALVFLSFFSKQYGLLVLPAMFGYVLQSPGKVSQKGMIYGQMFAGFSLCALLFVGFFQLQGVSVGLLLESLSGSNLGKGSYGARSVSPMFQGIFYFVLRAELFLLFIPLLLLGSKRLRQDRNFLFLVLLNLFSFLPLYFQTFTHYFQLSVPFSSLLAGYLIYFYFYLEKKPLWQAGGKLALALSLAVSLLFVGKIAFRFDLTHHKWDRQEQLATAERLREVVPGGSEVFMIGGEEMYLLNNYYPVAPKVAGYQFHGLYTPQETAAQIKPGQFLVLERPFWESHKPDGEGFSELGEVNGFKVFGLSGH